MIHQIMKMSINTLQEIEHQLNQLSNKVHSRDINFVMVEVLRRIIH